MQTENNTNPDNNIIGSTPVKQKKVWVTPTMEIIATNDVNAKGTAFHEATAHKGVPQAGKFTVKSPGGNHLIYNSSNFPSLHS